MPQKCRLEYANIKVPCHHQTGIITVYYALLRVTVFDDSTLQILLTKYRFLFQKSHVGSSVLAKFLRITHNFSFISEFSSHPLILFLETEETKTCYCASIFRIIDNIPVTWCYDIAGTGTGKNKYCSTGFPIGCYVTKGGKGKDACVVEVSVQPEP